MTQDEIIELAMAYGFTGGFNAQGDLTYDATFVEAVAEAVAKEREACAIISETPIYGEQDDLTLEAKDRVAKAIRARGKV